MDRLILVLFVDFLEVGKPWTKFDFLEVGKPITKTVAKKKKMTDRQSVVLVAKWDPSIRFTYEVETSDEEWIKEASADPQFD